jgi:DNA processing protein
MRQPTLGQAAVLAATEVVPADWHDLAALLQRYGGPGALLGGGPPGNDRDATLLRYLQHTIDHARIQYWFEKLNQLATSIPDIDFISIDSQDYPENLKDAYGSPPFLFTRGKIHKSDSLSLAIVGSRKATPEGLRAANDIASAAVQHGITVVSGLARGIDAAGHHAAINAGGRTIAAIAAGIDHPLSRESDLALSKVVPKFGSIVSQFRPGSPPTSSSYLQRNAVISGLALVSLAIEPGERSGTRNEIEHALRQGRKVLFWRPDPNAQSWVELYAKEPLAKVVSTEMEVVDEVFAVARKDARNEH